MRALLVVGVGVLGRLLSGRYLLGAALAGLLIGSAVLALPASDPELSRRAFAGLLAVGGAALVLPLAAASVTDARRGGTEALLFVRSAPSWSIGLGRCAGGVLGGAVLLLVLEVAARLVAGGAQVPDEVTGELVLAQADGRQWRFPLKTGSGGPFDLVLETVMLYGGSAELVLEVRRGGHAETVVREVRHQRRLLVSVPPLATRHGDLFVTVRPGPELVLAAAPPRLVRGSRTLGRVGLALSLPALHRLLLALVTVVAAASAFHFETACLAGLLALVVPRHEPLVLGATLLLLLGVAVLGAALVRRAALS